MTKYELATIIGARMEQLAFGAASTLSKEQLEGLHSVRDIAWKELRLKCIPMYVTRTLPNHQTERIDANHLMIVNYS